jgi:hypothetical protein
MYSLQTVPRPLTPLGVVPILASSAKLQGHLLTAWPHGLHARSRYNATSNTVNRQADINHTLQVHGDRERQQSHANNQQAHRSAPAR